jgi:hypothetical protein
MSLALGKLLITFCVLMTRLDWIGMELLIREHSLRTEIGWMEWSYLLESGIHTEIIEGGEGVMRDIRIRST